MADTREVLLRLCGKTYRCREFHSWRCFKPQAANTKARPLARKGTSLATLLVVFSYLPAVCARFYMLSQL